MSPHAYGRDPHDPRIGGGPESPSLQVGKCRLGAGRTAIIVPLTGADTNALSRQAVAARRETATDILEWRVDALLAAGGDFEAAAEVVHDAIDGLPLLVTVRTTAEGGAVDLRGDDLLAMYDRVLAAQIADLLDVQMLGEPQVAAAAVERARAAKVPVLGSHHRMEETPSPLDMLDALVRIEEGGADLAKLSVMPSRRLDVLALMEASIAATERLRIPMMTMSMGELGSLTRLAGGLLGQAATFAAVEEISAPGQLPVHVVDAALEALGARD